jgi:hypothetical protein
MRTSLTSHAVLGLALAIVASFPSDASAQRRNRGDNSSFGAPVATNTILANPAAFEGKPVTLSAGVEQILSQTAFVIDQQRAASASETKAVGKPMLVIAPYLTGALQQKQYLLMRGQVMTFDPAAIAKAAGDYTLDLAPDVSAKYAGLPVLVATSVLDSRYAELTKRPTPPVPPAAITKACD